MNGRTNIFIAALLSALVTGLGTVVYFSQTTISEQEVREAQIRHDAEDTERYKGLLERLDNLSAQQIVILQDEARTGVSIEDIMRRLDVLEAAVQIKSPR